jgi:hypothetical protein
MMGNHAKQIMKQLSYTKIMQLHSIPLQVDLNEKRKLLASVFFSLVLFYLLLFFIFGKDTIPGYASAHATRRYTISTYNL